MMIPGNARSPMWTRYTLCGKNPTMGRCPLHWVKYHHFGLNYEIYLDPYLKNYENILNNIQKVNSY